ncbi:MAG: hypothetical protein KatS3mg108_0464 [Isosphaeraceae bacterium]|jgi:hypothetical protein|nr:MAG: hypothetical protein KatS3mg108_0464 [Isosphaeraceae bacterium]
MRELLLAGTALTYLVGALLILTAARRPVAASSRGRS